MRNLYKVNSSEITHTIIIEGFANTRLLGTFEKMKIDQTYNYSNLRKYKFKNGPGGGGGCNRIICSKHIMYEKKKKVPSQKLF